MADEHSMSSSQGKLTSELSPASPSLEKQSSSSSEKEKGTLRYLRRLSAGTRADQLKIRGYVEEHTPASNSGDTGDAAKRKSESDGSSDANSASSPLKNSGLSKLKLKWLSLWNALDKSEERDLNTSNKERDWEEIRLDLSPKAKRLAEEQKSFPEADVVRALTKDGLNPHEFLRKSSKMQGSQSELSSDLTKSIDKSTITVNVKNVPNMLLKLQSSRTRSLELATLKMLSTHGIDSISKDNGVPLVEDPGYLGPHLLYPLSLENVIALIEHFRKLDDLVEYSKEASMARRSITKQSSTTHRVALHKDYVIDLLRRSAKMFEDLPNVVKVPLPTGDDALVHVVGDLHGQLEDLLHILEVKGYPNSKNVFIFNGDFVDRGHYGVEIVIILFSLKILYPNYVHLNRGNHESRLINLRDGFEKEVMSKYDVEVFDCFSQVFSTLPIACVIGKQVFVVHGGLAWENFTIGELNEVDRFVENPIPESILEDILWSDPSKNKGRDHNDRGCGIMFGPDVVQNWLTKNGLTAIVRSHQCVKKGVVRFFNGKLYTVFSASNYCGKANNQGAVLTFHTPDFPVPSAHQYYSVKKEELGRFNENVPGVPVVAQDVICRLVEKIMASRDQLDDYWKALVQSTPRRTAKQTLLTIDEWSRGLTSVLKLAVPWRDLAKYFPGTATSFLDDHLIDYEVFLEAHNPLHTVLKKFPSDLPRFDRKVEETLSRLMDIIHRNRHDLQDIFRWMDSDGSGELNFEEFRAGLTALHLISSADSQITDVVRQLFNRIDVNGDGNIAYQEFLEAFTNREILDNIVDNVESDSAEQKE